MQLVTEKMKRQYDPIIINDIGSVMSTISNIDQLIENKMLIRKNVFDMSECPKCHAFPSKKDYVVILPCGHIFCKYCHECYEEEMCIICKKKCVIYFSITKPKIIDETNNDYIPITNFQVNIEKKL
jgi:hypothetical protein